MERKFRIVLSIIILILICFNINIYFATKSKEEVRVPILLYHNIVADNIEDIDTVANMSVDEFKSQMQGILQKGYTPIKLSDYYNYVINSTVLPTKPIIITFDDGYSSNYEYAYPILKELKIPATIFVVTDTIGAIAGGGKVNFSHFTWNQAREMEASGLIDIQSHSHTHQNMALLSASELQTEVRKSKYLIEKNLGKKCYIFAYPYGGYTGEIKKAIRWAGYKMQILVNDESSNEDYRVNAVSDGLENITRLTVRGHMSNDDLFEMIDTAMANY